MQRIFCLIVNNWLEGLSRKTLCGWDGVQALQSQGISHVVQLEQWLMEGAYNKVLDARPNLPDLSYGYFMEKLLSTVRSATHR